MNKRDKLGTKFINYLSLFSLLQRFCLIYLLLDSNDSLKSIINIVIHYLLNCFIVLFQLNIIKVIILKEGWWFFLWGLRNVKRMLLFFFIKTNRLLIIWTKIIINVIFLLLLIHLLSKRMVHLCICKSSLMLTLNLFSSIWIQRLGF